MPDGWVAPPVRLRHGGYIVYETYKNGHNQDETSDYIFTVSSTDEDGEFDVRELPGHGDESKGLDDLLREMIDSEELWDYIPETVEPDEAHRVNVECYALWPSGKWNFITVIIWEDEYDHDDGEVADRAIEKAVSQMDFGGTAYLRTARRAGTWVSHYDCRKAAVRITRK